MAPKIFPGEGFVSGSTLGKLFKGVKGKARFDAENLENIVKEMVSRTLGGEGEHVLQTEQSEQESPQCRTLAISIPSSTHTK